MREPCPTTHLNRTCPQPYWPGAPAGGGGEGSFPRASWPPAYPALGPPCEARSGPWGATMAPGGAPAPDRGLRREPCERRAGFARRGHLGLVRPYSLLGTRADADLLLAAAPTPEGLQGFAARLRATELALTWSGPTTTSPSPGARCTSNATPATPAGRWSSRRGALPVRLSLRQDPRLVRPSMEERQRMMDEHIRTGRKYPGSRSTPPTPSAWTTRSSSSPSRGTARASSSTW